jgi:hypothetical protein
MVAQMFMSHISNGKVRVSARPLAASASSTFTCG